MTVDGLSYRLASGATLRAADDGYIRAIAGAWCANTVRIQLGQDAVNFDGNAFLAAVSREVRLAERLGLVVVLDDQTESEAGNEPMPTAASSAFWQRIARVYGHDPQIIFDAFNEPRRTAEPLWPTWQHAMQRLVDTIRRAGARNLLWIEGPVYATTLANVVRYPIRDTNTVYAEHHPQGAHNLAAWRRDFGYLIERHVHAVVEGEWSQYASTRSECWQDAPTATIALLRYLQALGTGLIAWGIEPGRLVGTNPSIPTRFDKDWRCADGVKQSAGAVIMNWFKQQNRSL